MTTAIYLAESTTQLVLTPSNSWERQILRMLHESFKEQSYWGEFYGCQGGWIRWTERYNEREQQRESDSLIFRLEKKMDIPVEER